MVGTDTDDASSTSAAAVGVTVVDRIDGFRLAGSWGGAASAVSCSSSAVGGVGVDDAAAISPSI